MKATVAVWTAGLILLLVNQGWGSVAAPSELRVASEDEARHLLRETSDLYFTLLNSLKDETLGTDSGFYDRRSSIESFHNLVTAIARQSQIVRHFPRQNIHDPDLIRQLDHAGFADSFALGSTDFWNFVQVVSNLEDMAHEENICSYHNTDYCEYSYVPDVRRILYQSHDAHELKYYWEEWRKRLGTTAKDNLGKFVDYFRNASRLNDKSPLDLWFSTYEDPRFLEVMEDVMKQIRPFYTQFHAYVRHVLNKKYGELVVPQSGPIPAHLIEQILIQAWKKNSLLEHPYPDKKLPNMKEQLDQHGINSRRLVDITDEFFRSLGFDSLPQEFWTKYLKPKSKEEVVGDCKSEVFDATPSVGLKYCPKSNFKKFLQTHGDMARLHYANQKRRLPIVYFDSYEFEYAVGEAMILSASTPKHIQRIGLLRNYRYDEQLSMNRLFRLGLHTMFNIPMHFVFTKVMAEFVSGTVPLEHMNRRYWELMVEYAGIEPPSDRKPSDIDFPYKFYDDLDENHHSRKFVNEILGYQLYRSLCKISGGYVRGNPNQPLQNCDLYGSHEAGNALKRMMSLGSTRPWKDVLGEIVEDEANINAAALLEFYEPLRNWLEGQNNLNNLEIGWTSSKHQF